MFDSLYHSFLLRPYAKRLTRAIRGAPKLYLFDFLRVPASAAGARLENLVALHLLKACHYRTDNRAGGIRTAFRTRQGATRGGSSCRPLRKALVAGGVQVRPNRSRARAGQTVCSSTKPCSQGLCMGASCGDTWTCVVDGRDCTGSLTDYCGCDGVTFLDSWACPASPFDHLGACGPVLANCDQRDVACKMLPPTCGPGQFPAVVGSCWDGTCVPIEQCQCTVMEECPGYLGPGYSEFECCGSQHCCPLER